LNDEKIITAIRQGDETAIDRVITKYARLLWTIADAVLKNAGSAEDVEECVADVFIHLWQHPDKFDPTRGSLRSWLSMVARSKAIDRYRLLIKRENLLLEENLPVQQLGLADHLLAEETRHALQEAISTLEHSDREILLRRYYLDQKPREIALALDLTVKHVNNRLYRAKQKLRDMIDNEEFCR